MIEIEKPTITKFVDENGTYGKFVVEPLERGYGTTLGNCMRRILLSSLPGAAVTSVKIDGILHEFSTIPGVKEDVTEIILNLKKLAVRLDVYKRQGHETVEIPASKIKKSIAEILLEEGYINGFEVIEDNKQGIIKVQMKYGANKERVITGIKKISKPGLKVYAKANEVPKVLGGLGTVSYTHLAGCLFLLEK